MVGQAKVTAHALAGELEAFQFLLRVVAVINDQVVAVRVGQPETINQFGFKHILGQNLFLHL